MSQVHNGMKVQRFARGDRDTILSASRANELVDPLNALLHIEVKRGQRDEVIYSDNGVLIMLKQPGGGMGGSTVTTPPPTTVPIGIDDFVLDIDLMPNGQIVIVGGFSIINGVHRGHAAVLNADLSLADICWHHDPSIDFPKSVAFGENLAGTGKDDFFVGGGQNLTATYTDYVPTIYLGLLAYKDGSTLLAGLPDTTSSINTTTVTGHVYNSVEQVKLFPALSYPYVFVGNFDIVNGSGTQCICRMSRAGTIDPGFTGGGFDVGVGNVANRFCAAPSAGYFLLGLFQVSSLSKYLVRIGGLGGYDSSFDLPVGATTGAEYLYVGGPSDMVVRADNELMVVGNFSIRDSGGSDIGGYGIAHINSDGSIDNGFLVDIGQGGFSRIAIQGDGKYVVYGITSDPFTGVLRINTDGTEDATFNRIAVTPTVTGVNDIVIEPSGTILIGGDFTDVNGDSTKAYLCRLSSTGIPQ